MISCIIPDRKGVDAVERAVFVQKASELEYPLEAIERRWDRYVEAVGDFGEQQSELFLVDFLRRKYIPIEELITCSLSLSSAGR